VNVNAIDIEGCSDWTMESTGTACNAAGNRIRTGLLKFYVCMTVFYCFSFVFNVAPDAASVVVEPRVEFFNERILILSICIIQRTS